MFLSGPERRQFRQQTSHYQQNLSGDTERKEETLVSRNVEKLQVKTLNYNFGQPLSAKLAAGRPGQPGGQRPEEFTLWGLRGPELRRIAINWGTGNKGRARPSTDGWMAIHKSICKTRPRTPGHEKNEKNGPRYPGAAPQTPPDCTPRKRTRGAMGWSWCWPVTRVEICMEVESFSLKRTVTSFGKCFGLV